MRTDKRNALAFFDTTFMLPFFQIDIRIEAFTLGRFKTLLRDLAEVHFSELSIYEVKAKLHRLSRRDKAVTPALEAFGSNLSILQADEKFVLHPYSERDDSYFNLISEKNLELDSFDTIILAQAFSIGLLITEDERILMLRSQKAFTSDSILGKMKIRRWKELES